MANTTISLGRPGIQTSSLLWWNFLPGAAVPGFLSTSGQTIYLRRFSLDRFQGVRFQVAAQASGADGPDLTPEWEQYASAITLSRGRGTELTIAGPDYPGNRGSGERDPTEPYEWFLPSRETTALVAFIAASRSAGQDAYSLILDDGVPTIIDASPIAWSMTIPNATGELIQPNNLKIGAEFIDEMKIGDEFVGVMKIGSEIVYRSG